MIIIVSVLTLVVISGMFFKNIKIIWEVNKSEIYGLIDTSLTMKYDNMVINQFNMDDEPTKTHGDKMISFIRKLSPKSKIYYYDASDETGDISTYSIIEGLEWMISNDISKVNISLSSKEYSEELENWIQNHKDEIQIFASYNNQLNTFDYPAMYDHVIASGSDENIGYKENDKGYSSDLVLLTTNFKIYRGNSYLSIVTMVQSE